DAGAAGGVRDGLDRGRALPVDGVLDVAVVQVRRAGHAGRRRAAAAAQDALAHQNTPMRMPMSSALVSPPNLTTARLPSLVMRVLTVATWQENSVSMAFFTSGLVAGRRTRNSSELFSSIRRIVFSVTMGCSRTSCGWLAG